MHPIELIEHLMAAVMVMLIFAASYVFRGKWRTLMRLLGVLCIIAYAVFYAIRPSLTKLGENSPTSKHLGRSPV